MKLTIKECSFFTELKKLYDSAVLGLDPNLEDSRSFGEITNNLHDYKRNYQEQQVNS